MIKSIHRRASCVPLVITVDQISFDIGSIPTHPFNTLPSSTAPSIQQNENQNQHFLLHHRWPRNPRLPLHSSRWHHGARMCPLFTRFRRRSWARDRGAPTTVCRCGQTWVPRWIVHASWTGVVNGPYGGLAIPTQTKPVHNQHQTPVPTTKPCHWQTQTQTWWHGSSSN